MAGSHIVLVCNVECKKFSRGDPRKFGKRVKKQVVKNLSQIFVDASIRFAWGKYYSVKLSP